jgi:RNA polymerase sigma-70 factor (ECF subfamily)
LQADDAADVVQEVCRSVHRCIGDFKHSATGAFRSWLWTIVRHKIVDLLRARRIPAVGGGVHHETLQHLAAEPDFDETEPTYDGDKSALMRRALGLIEPEFEPRSWQAFWRSAVEGKLTSDIAADLAMTQAAVRKAKSRILLRLRTVLADLGEELGL